MMLDRRLKPVQEILNGSGHRGGLAVVIAVRWAQGQGVFLVKIFVRQRFLIRIVLVLLGRSFRKKAPARLRVRAAEMALVIVFHLFHLQKLVRLVVRIVFQLSVQMMALAGQGRIAQILRRIVMFVLI